MQTALPFYDGYKGPEVSNRSKEMDKHGRKSIQRKTEAIFKKAEDRE
jgi:hypothetical protein